MNISNTSYILEYIYNESLDSWWPGLVEKVLHNNPATCYPEGSYSTTAILSNNKNQPELEIPLEFTRKTVIELIPENIFSVFSDRGFVQLDKKKAISTAVELILKKSFELIDSAPRLLDTVFYMVRSMHLLSARQGYDISFTDPDMNFSIFLSIPLDDSNEAAYRVAESIIHEAMHLQLTIIEKEVNFLEDNEATAYSPWKKTHRSIYGVLHAVYVFSVIYQWLDTIEESQLGYKYSARRKYEIIKEMKLVDLDSCLLFLTPAGKKFLRGVILKVGI